MDRIRTPEIVTWAVPPSYGPLGAVSGTGRDVAAVHSADTASLSGSDNIAMHSSDIPTCLHGSHAFAESRGHLVGSGGIGEVVGQQGGMISMSFCRDSYWTEVVSTRWLENSKLTH